MIIVDNKIENKHIVCMSKCIKSHDSASLTFNIITTKCVFVFGNWIQFCNWSFYVKILVNKRVIPIYY